MPEHERARAQMLVDDARQAIKEEAPLDRLRSLSAELQQVYHGLGAATTTGAPPPRQERPGGGDDVIDAEFTTDE